MVAKLRINRSLLKENERNGKEGEGEDDEGDGEVMNDYDGDGSFSLNQFARQPMAPLLTSDLSPTQKLVLIVGVTVALMLANWE